MAACRKYTNKEGVTLTYRKRPFSDCQNCAYFSSKNCGAHSVSFNNISPSLE